MTALAQPLDQWVSVLDGVEAKLHAGACVAVVRGGSAATPLADAFPDSRIDAFENHEFPGAFYDLVASLDCLRDLPDPVAAAQHVHRRLADDGTWLAVDRGDRGVAEIMRAAGFASVRRVAETPLHLVFEARP
jgi:hypothetical protein